MKKTLFLLSTLILTACLEKTEEKKSAATSELDGFKLGIVVSSDLQDVYFDRAANGAAREFIQQHPNMSITFKNANDDFETQKAQVKEELDRGVQALVLHIGGMNISQTSEIVNMICNAKVPVVFHNVAPRDEILASCPTAYFVGSDNADIGTTQGLAVVDYWTKHPEWDKNSDGIIQFAQVCLGEKWAPGVELNSWAHNTITNYPKLGIGAEQILSAYPGFQYNFDSLEKEFLRWKEDPNFGNLELVLSCADGLSDKISEVFKKHDVKYPIFSMEGSEWAREAVTKGVIVHTTPFQLKEEVNAAINMALNMALNRDIGTNIPYLIKDKKVRVGAGK